MISRAFRAVLGKLPWIVACLCLAGFLPWILGVPGVEGNDYARGWMIGLYAILAFPACMLVLGLAGLLFRLSGRGPAGPVRRGMGWAALAVFLAVQAYAWSLILA